MRIEILGVYPVENANETCHLIELIVTNYVGKLDFSQFTQKIEGEAQTNWQVPYDEYVLNENGNAGKLAPFPGPLEINGDQRISFFFHYLDLAKSLWTPIGNIALPFVTNRPERLSFIGYEAPF